MIADFNLCLKEMAAEKAKQEAAHAQQVLKRRDEMRALAQEADRAIDKRKRLDQELVERIKDKANQGLPIAKIFKEFDKEGVSRHSVKHYVYLAKKERKAKKC